MLYLFLRGTRLLYVYFFLPPPALPAPALPPRPRPRAPARSYGQAGGPREAAGGGPEKAGAKGGRPAGKGATADGNDSRGCPLRIARNSRGNSPNSRRKGVDSPEKGEIASCCTRKYRGEFPRGNLEFRVMAKSVRTPMPAPIPPRLYGGNPDDRHRHRRPQGPARQRPAAPPGSRVPHRPPRALQDRRDRQGPGQVGRRGRQRADHPRRPGRGRPPARQADQLPGELGHRRRSLRHHAQGPPRPQAGPAPAAPPPPPPPPRRPRPLARRQAGCGRPGHPPRRPGLPAEVAGRHARRRGPAQAARRRRAGPAVRAARYRQDQPDRGGLRR